ncbi:hypothetical protein DFP72DRAFT_1077683 [Ephemerocybe angulata]|uniref:Uncharacterized protein n=1 Tax=Ephemerocybe angulata TaxID=980116 RepID=A0A8H6LX07_9AGAR|nr:hypothetical protein DFP72DRAFT_1077683 [Tulosesus angulatus]
MRCNVPKEHCVEDLDAPPTYPLGDTTSFDLPMTSRSLHLFVKGRFSHGRVQVIASVNQNKENVKVVLSTRFRQEGTVKDFFSLKEVSGRLKDEHGVEISMKMDIPKGHVYQDIKMIFPAPTGPTPTWVPKFEINVEGRHQIHFKHGGHIAFGTLRVQVAEGDIYALPGYVEMDDGYIATEKGWIEGLFRSNNYLWARTWNGNIRAGFISEGTLSIRSEGSVDVDLTANQQDSSIGNDISLHAADGNLDADIFLNTTIDRPQYIISALSDCGNIHAKIHDMPEDASLNFAGNVSRDPGTCSIFIPYRLITSTTPYKFSSTSNERGKVIHFGAGEPMTELISENEYESS